MLPTPLISDWSSRARLIPVRRCRSLAANRASSNAASSGSGALCAIAAGSSAPPRSSNMWPNVRWSTNRRSGPSSANANLTRTCGVTGRAGSPMTSWPLMPRCMSRASPSTGSHKYLPRRRGIPALRPASALLRSPAPARCRRTARGCSTSTVEKVRPATCRSRPLLIVSTSGSSGTGVAWPLGPVPPADRRAVVTGGAFVARLAERGSAQPGGQGGPCRLGRLLLGLLLGAPDALAVDLTGYPGHGAERLLMVGAALIDQVLGRAEVLGSRQRLQRGLPVEAGPEASRPRDHRIEQPVHERLGLGHALVQVDRA